MLSFLSITTRPEDYSQKSNKKTGNRDATVLLKNWLFEHRKDPYPTKEEKMTLAMITRMNLTQVSTWFANARRRLKKENQMTWSARNRTISVCDLECDLGRSKRDEWLSQCWPAMAPLHQPANETRVLPWTTPIIQNNSGVAMKSNKFLEVYLSLVCRSLESQASTNLLPPYHAKNSTKIWSLADFALGQSSSSTSSQAGLFQPLDFRHQL